MPLNVYSLYAVYTAVLGDELSMWMTRLTGSWIGQSTVGWSS